MLSVIHSIGLILLAVYLIVTGVCTVFSVGPPVLHIMLGVVAFAVGIFILIGR